MYYESKWRILNQKFFEHQLETRKTKDWATQILNDLTEFKIEDSMIEIRNYSIEKWKQSIKTKATTNALSYLNTNIGSKSYEKLKMWYFLCSDNCEDIPIELAKFIAKIQSHLVEKAKTNFSSQYKLNFICNSCQLKRTLGYSLHLSLKFWVF